MHRGHIHVIPKPKDTPQGLQRKALCGAPPRAEPSPVGRLPQSRWVSTGGVVLCVLPELLDVSTYSHILPASAKDSRLRLSLPTFPFVVTV